MLGPDEHQHWRQSFDFTRCASSWRFWSTWTGCATCATSSRGCCARDLDVIGFFMNEAASLRISSGTSREEQVLALRRKQREDAPDVVMKPMSSMRSPSSSTRICTWRKSTVFCCTWSSSRPGVATRMSTPRRSASTCGCMRPRRTPEPISGSCTAIGAHAFFDLRGELPGRVMINARTGWRAGEWLHSQRWQVFAIWQCEAGGLAGAVWAARAGRGRRARPGSPAPGWGWVGCSLARRRRAAARATGRVVQTT